MNAHSPYALVAPEFRFRALATLAGRAALGGSRELLLGTLLIARLVDGVTGTQALPAALRRARSSGAKSWLAALALPASSRAALARLIESTAGDDRRALSDAWDALLQLVTPALDMPSRVELRRVGVAVHALS